VTFPQDALDRLRQGNRRFVSGEKTADERIRQTQRDRLVGDQQPFAAILGCSDSRVPVEIIFDQGPGDLFVIRIAGNIVTPSVVGSIEFAAERIGARLVVVLGHSHCGAVKATLDEIQRPTEGLLQNWSAVVNRIRPAVEGFLATGPANDHGVLVQQAIRANVRASASYLRTESAVLGRLIQEDELLVLGAEYSLETGVVDFFDGSECLKDLEEDDTGWVS
jgi:carbonic anhydrase